MTIWKWTTLAGSTLLMAGLITGCPEKKAAPAPEAAPGEKAEEKVAAKEEEKPAPPAIPEGVEHLKNEKWVDGPDPEGVPAVDPKAANEAYGKVAGPGEAALAAACAADATKVYKLDPAVSRVGFVSYKNETVLVPGKFGDIHGFAVLGEKPALSFWANALTVNTGNEGRDKRVAKLFFEVEQGENAAMTFTASEITGLPAALPSEEGAAVELTVKGDLLMHGKTQGLEVPMTLKREGDAWTVEQRDLTLIPFEPFGLKGPLATLMEACNHKSIGTSVRLKLKLRVVPGC
ncbi:MAG: YceI family protein [Deltaproteobacteria bacterium]|nr:YceI family protein [Deltaproteobacteria bacterium]